MKVELKIGKEIFDVVMMDMTAKAVGDYYGTNHPHGWGYKLTESSVSYTTCRGDTHGVKNVDGQYIAFIEGLRSTAASFVNPGSIFVNEPTGDVMVLRGYRNRNVKSRHVSGMAGFSANVLYVKSGHPSLTSMCRERTQNSNSV